jgi:hypothetical protein
MLTAASPRAAERDPVFVRQPSITKRGPAGERRDLKARAPGHQIFGLCDPVVEHHKARPLPAPHEGWWEPAVQVSERTEHRHQRPHGTDTPPRLVTGSMGSHDRANSVENALRTYASA